MFSVDSLLLKWTWGEIVTGVVEFPVGSHGLSVVIVVIHWGVVAVLVVVLGYVSETDVVSVGAIVLQKSNETILDGFESDSPVPLKEHQYLPAAS